MVRWTVGESVRVQRHRLLHVALLERRVASPPQLRAPTHMQPPTRTRAPMPHANTATPVAGLYHATQHQKAVWAGFSRIGRASRARIPQSRAQPSPRCPHPHTCAPQALLCAPPWPHAESRGLQTHPRPFPLRQQRAVRCGLHRHAHAAQHASYISSRPPLATLVFQTSSGYCGRHGCLLWTPTTHQAEPARGYPAHGES
jgi:hypothetical protein